MVLMATVGVIGISYLTFHRAKINTVVGIKDKSDRDLEDATMRLGTIFMSPAHCNANFKNKPFDKSTTPINNALTGQIRTCAAGADCYTNISYGTDFIPIIPDIPANTNLWKVSDTGLTDRIRVIKAAYFLNIDQAPRAGGPLTNIRAGVLSVRVTFQKNLGFANGVRHTTNITKDFDAFVVSSVWHATPPPFTMVQQANILGCSWSPDSTNVYKQ